jgi:hypothetical protein
LLSEDFGLSVQRLILICSGLQVLFDHEIQERCMVSIIGNIKPEDDYTHELGPEPNFNESVYFNFFDPVQNRGGFVRIGNRANEGYAEMTVIV